jgi:fatty acid desaturase
VATQEREQKLRAREAWLEASMIGLRRGYERSPFIAALVLLAIPAWMLGGGLVAFYVAFMASVLVGVWIYVAWSHLHENEIELKTVRSELQKLATTPDDATKDP